MRAARSWSHQRMSKVQNSGEVRSVAECNVRLRGFVREGSCGVEADPMRTHCGHTEKEEVYMVMSVIENVV